MLKPFRIRDLLSEAEAPNSNLRHQKNGHADDGRASSQGSGSHKLSEQLACDGVVQVTSSQYDETIAKNPDACLSYVDEDDGETITVGSSLELAQRLDEPIPHWLLSAQSAVGTLNGGDDPDPMHIFDIRRTPAVLKIWRDLHSRTLSQPTTSNGANMFLQRESTSVKVSKDGSAAYLPSSNSTTTVVPTDSTTDPRRRWVQECDPPRLDVQTSVSEPKKDLDSGKDIVGSKDSGHNGFSPRSEGDTSYITEEGRKQAKIAGAKLREARNLFYSISRSGSFLPPSSNFWSTYSQAEQAFSSASECSSRQEQKKTEPPTDEQSLFNAFENELARLMAASNLEKLPASKTPGASEERRTEPVPSNENPSRQGVTSSPGEVAALTLQTLLQGVAHLTSELRTRLPDVERRLASLQHNIPAQVESRVNTALQGFKTHVQTLTNVMQDAARSTRTAAERSRESQTLASAQVDALRNLAHEIGEMVKTLLAAFESWVPTGSVAQRSQPSEEQSPQESGSKGNAPTHSQANHFVAANSTNSQNYYSEATLSPTSETTLFIGNVSPNATEETICDALVAQGFLGKTTLLKDSTTGVHAGFGQIQFPSTYAASGALQALQGMNICGQSVNLEFIQGSARVSQAVESKTEYKGQNLGQQRSPVRENGYPTTATSKCEHSVENAVPPLSTGDSATIRRTISLGHLRAHYNERDVGKADDKANPSQLPRVPSKDTLDETNADHGARTERSTSGVGSTLLDKGQTDVDFSARYPPLPIPLNTQSMAPRRGHSVGQAAHAPARERDFLHFPAPALTDTLPGAFPLDPAPEQRSTGLKQRTSIEAPTRSFSTRHAPKAMPGSWPPDLGVPSVRRSATERRHGRKSLRHAFVERHHRREHHDYFPMRFLTTPGNFLVENERSIYPSHGGDDRQPEVTENLPMSEIDTCVAHLKALGFADGDIARLRFYAEAADGNLGDAIEMIEDERRALEQHGTALP
ncbi:hypothetical protein VTO42DRAFT_931 [Malbranchea cinnamomea]